MGIEYMRKSKLKDPFRKYYNCKFRKGKICTLTMHNVGANGYSKKAHCKDCEAFRWR